jgi:hypothetical protein
MPLATAWRTKETASRSAAPPIDEPVVTRTGRRGRYAPQLADHVHVARPAMVALGVLLIVGCATAGVVLAGRTNHDSPYLVAVRAIPSGTKISVSDLGVVALDPPTDLAAVPAASEPAVVGQEAQYAIAAGSLLNRGELTNGAPLLAGEAVVGASLASNQLPDELVAGDNVLVVYTSSAVASLGGVGGLGSPVGPPSGSPAAPPGGTARSSSPGNGAGDTAGGTGQAASGTGQAAGGTGQAGGETGQSGGPGTVLANAQVLDIVLPGSPSAASVATGSLVTVSLAVPERAAPLVAAASAANDISLALVPAVPAGRVGPAGPAGPKAPRPGRTR